MDPGFPENPKQGYFPDAKIRGVGNPLGGEDFLTFPESETAKNTISPLEDIHLLKYPQLEKGSRTQTNPIRI